MKHKNKKSAEFLVLRERSTQLMAHGDWLRAMASCTMKAEEKRAKKSQAGGHRASRGSTHLKRLSRLVATNRCTQERVVANVGSLLASVSW
jgi:hypothetical protein